MYYVLCFQLLYNISDPVWTEIAFLFQFSSLYNEVVLSLVDDYICFYFCKKTEDKIKIKSKIKTAWLSGYDKEKAFHDTNMYDAVKYTPTA